MKIYKAIAIGNQEVPDLKLTATEQVPDYKGLDWREHFETLCQEQGEYIHLALKNTLPQATMNILFAIMAKDRAGVTMVSSE